MTSYPVLDDCTKDAAVIGTATNAADAAKVLANHYAANDLTDLAAPAMYCHRETSSLSDDVAAECPNGAWEPVWAA